MPAKRAKKTASAPKAPRSRIIQLVQGGGIVACLLAGVGIFLVLARASSQQACELRLDQTESPLCLQLERVSTPKELEKGLSGRQSLPPNNGMLFSFERDEKWCFWMKDTRFPIDIVWLNDSKQVVYIVREAQPSSYPTPFCPSQDARYVIEVNAGVVDRANIGIGSQLQF